MRKLFLLTSMLPIFLMACHTTNTAIKERISLSDSVAINYFAGDGKMDTVVLVKIIKDKKVIEELCGLIASKQKTIKNNCGYDGSLHFFKQNIVIQNIDFRMNDADCMQFSFMQDGVINATRLSAEAKSLLEKLKR